MSAPLNLTLALCAALAAGQAKSDIDRVSVLVGSNHVGSEVDFNEENLGLFLTWEDAVGSVDLTAGVYHNSYSETSVAFTASYDFIEWDNGALGVFGGLAHYGDNAKFFPIDVNGWTAIGGIQGRLDNAFFQVLPMEVNGRISPVYSFGFTFEVSP